MLSKTLFAMEFVLYGSMGGTFEIKKFIFVYSIFVYSIKSRSHRLQNTLQLFIKIKTFSFAILLFEILENINAKMLLEYKMLNDIQ